MILLIKKIAREPLLVSLLFFTSQVLGQNQVFRFITSDDGLPDNEVFDVTQSGDGAMWIATDLGICRYNGKRFTYLRNPTQRSKAFTGLQEDQWGRMWAYNFFGEIFYIEKDSLRIFESFDPNKSNSLHSMAWNSRKDLFIVCASGGTLIYKLYKDRNNVLRDSLVKSWDIPSINPVFDSKGTVWMVGFSKNDFDIILNYDLQTKKLSTYPVFGQIIKQSSRLNLLFESRDSTYMLDRINRRLYVKRNNAFYFKKVFKDIAYVNEIVTDRNGQVSLLTRQGLYTVDENWELRLQYPTFAGNNVSRKITDHEGNIWITTLDAGIGVVPDSRLKIWQNFDTLYGTNNITAMAKGPDHSLFLGFTNGIIILFDPKTGYSEKIIKPEIPGEVTFIFYDDFNRLLTWYNNRTYTALFSKPVKPVTQVSLSSVKDIAYAPWNKQLVVATGTGIESVPASLIRTKGPENLYRDKRQFLSAIRSRAIATDTIHKIIYAATRNGLEKWDSLGHQTLLTLNGTPVYATQIKESNNKFWISTINHGLLTIENGILKKDRLINQKLISQTILQLAIDPPYCWINTEIGLQLIHLETGETALLNKDNGLPTSQINGIFSENKTLYIASPRGLIFTSYLTPEPQKTNVLNPSVRYIYLKKKKITPEMLSGLNYDENELEFEIELPSFKTRQGVNFQYKLQHNGKGIWRKNEDGRLIFDQLLPGNYQLIIQATDMNGSKIGIAKNIYFFIRKPFWETTAWYIILSLIIGITLWLWIRFYINKLRKIYAEKQEKLKLYEDLKKSMLVSIKAQMNPHFIFNALNTIQSFIYNNNKQEANEYLVKFSRLMRMVLEMSNYEKILLAEELMALELYLDLEKSRFEDSLKYTIALGEEVKPAKIRIPSMIIQPFVENAIKHGLLHRIGERILNIDFQHDQVNAVLEVTIEDNGIGRVESERMNQKRKINHLSFSSKANEKRLELLNADAQKPIGIEYVDKYHENGEAAGTIVKLKIPC